MVRIVVKIVTILEWRHPCLGSGYANCKDQASEILRNVREHQEKYVVTYHGRPMAVILAVDDEPLESEMERIIEAATPTEGVWAELEALRQEIDANWESEKTAVELVSER